MADPRPLLFFPKPAHASVPKDNGGASKCRFPGRHRQAERLDPQFALLQSAFERAPRVSGEPGGAVPEQVVVLETVDGVEGFRQAAQLMGLEWLGEFDADDVHPDEDFFVERDEKDTGKEKDQSRSSKDLPTRLYLILANQRAITQLLFFWERWKKVGKDALRRGLKQWAAMFSQLRDVRLWGPQDRMGETGILEDWREHVRDARGPVRFHAELWLRNSVNARAQARQRIQALLAAENGRVLAEEIIPEIAYHGILAELPVQAVEHLLTMPDAPLVHAEGVMFFRPCGQGATGPLAIEENPETRARTRPSPRGRPVVALLDGLPIQNHELLAGRVIVDDPDDWSPTYPTIDRKHGTAMASLIVHGDLGEDGPALGTPLFALPVTRPGGDASGRELVPHDRLTIDVIHRAVRRMLDPAAGAVAATVRVVNLSIGDPHYPFDRFLSPWARLLDWLSAKYGVLFVVSAGNCDDQIEVDLPRATMGQAEPAELHASVLTAIARDMRNRALLAPAEAMNVLTVGACPADAAQVPVPPNLRVLLDREGLPATFSRLGLGYRRAIKPDLLAPGGRAWHREKITAGPNVVFDLASGPKAAGQQHAWPGPSNRHSARSIGTSNAAALCSRSIGLANEVLAPLLEQQLDGAVAPTHHALLLRVLAIHTADWGDARQHLEPVLAKLLIDARRIREHVGRFVGYGTLRPDRMVTCADQRATAIGFASLRAGAAHQYRFPLPPSLEGHAGYRHLTITLAWFTPIHPGHRRYRRAQLWFTVPQLVLPIDRRQADMNAALRGTVQHEVFDGQKTAIFGDATEIVVQVNCAEDAGPFEGEVAYALACTLEVPEGIAVPIYEEVRARVAVRVHVRPG